MPSPQDIGRKILSSAKVAAKCGITTRGLFNWKHNPSLGFPAGLRINDRDFFYEDEIDAWLLERAKDAIKLKRARLASNDEEAA